MREIAAELGVPTTTVYRWADPAYAARQNASQRRWKRRNPERARAGRDRYLERAARRCSTCGRPPATPNGGGDDPVLCCGCLDTATAERRRRVRELPARGAGLAVIAARLGPARGTVANDELRGRGRAPPARPNGFDPTLEAATAWSLTSTSGSGRSRRRQGRSRRTRRDETARDEQQQRADPWPTGCAER